MISCHVMPGTAAKFPISKLAEH